VSIPQGRFDIGMTEHFLHLIDRHSVLDQTGRKGVTEGVYGNICESAPLECLSYGDGCVVAWTAILVGEYEVGTPRIVAMA